MSSGAGLPLRKGYTTGTCAQAAVKAAMLMLTAGRTVSEVEVETPSGVRLTLRVIGQETGEGFARCGVVKDAGEDQDITHGAEIYAVVKLAPGGGIRIRGGRGVGTVTKPGLPVPPGEPAINPVPKRMIAGEVAALLPSGCGADVTIEVPDGERLATQTFNPRLGVMGGISILGTSGIVEPRSQEAYKASLALEIRVARAGGFTTLALCPGYLGEAYCRRNSGVAEQAVIRVGDHVGFALERCREDDVEEVLLAGHVGKLVKVAAGQFNTHYSAGDGRVETIAHYAALCGAGPEALDEIRAQDTAEATVAILRRHGLMAAFGMIAEKVVRESSGLVAGRPAVRVVLLDLKGEVLGKYRGSDE